MNNKKSVTHMLILCMCGFCLGSVFSGVFDLYISVLENELRQKRQAAFPRSCDMSWMWLRCREMSGPIHTLRLKSSISTSISFTKKYLQYISKLYSSFHTFIVKNFTVDLMPIFYFCVKTYRAGRGRKPCGLILKLLPTSVVIISQN